MKSLWKSFKTLYCIQWSIQKPIQLTNSAITPVYTKSDQSSMYPNLVTFRLISCFYRSDNSLVVFTGYFVQNLKYVHSS